MLKHAHPGATNTKNHKKKPKIETQNSTKKPKKSRKKYSKEQKQTMKQRKKRCLCSAKDLECPEYHIDCMNCKGSIHKSSVYKSYYGYTDPKIYNKRQEVNPDVECLACCLCSGVLVCSQIGLLCCLDSMKNGCTVNGCGETCSNLLPGCFELDCSCCSTSCEGCSACQCECQNCQDLTCIDALKACGGCVCSMCVKLLCCGVCEMSE